MNKENDATEIKKKSDNNECDSDGAKLTQLTTNSKTS
jgi:hypothetical protein